MHHAYLVRLRIRPVRFDASSVSLVSINPYPMHLAVRYARKEKQRHSGDDLSVPIVSPVPTNRRPDNYNASRVRWVDMLPYRVNRIVSIVPKEPRML